MPQIGHGLVGLGAGAAAVGVPRSTALNACWFGALVLLAYVPDVAEWLAGLLGWFGPHSALAGVPALLVTGVLVVILLRFGFREKRLVVFIVAVSVLASHTLLDALDGGIPLLWPFGRGLIGARWLPITGDTAAQRLRAECLVFLPLAGLGIAIGILRMRHARGRKPWRAAFQARALANLIPLMPVIMLGAVQVHAAEQARRGAACERQGQLTEAIAHYRAAARFRPLGLEIQAIYRIALCQRRTGAFGLAYVTLTDALRRDPQNLLLNVGLADLYLTAVGTEYHRPADARRLAEYIIARSERESSRTLGEKLLERARRAEERARPARDTQASEGG